MFLETFGIEICPVTPEQAQIARARRIAISSGSGHRANLNFGDCFSYALAKDRREGLMFKSDDFNHTDLGPDRGVGSDPAANRMGTHNV